MSNTEFNCLPTIIGSVPHTDAAKACTLVTRYLKDIPTWPQLPKKWLQENMYVQYSEGFPGATLESNRFYIDTSKDYSKSLEALYVAFLNNDYKTEYNILEKYWNNHRSFRMIIYYTGLTLILYCSGGTQKFIYSQF